MAHSVNSTASTQLIHWHSAVPSFFRLNYGSVSVLLFRTELNEMLAKWKFNACNFVAGLARCIVDEKLMLNKS